MSTAEFGCGTTPLFDLAEAAIEPIPDYGEFLILWRAFLTERLNVAIQKKIDDEPPPEHHWLEEVATLLDEQD